jgi:hypothetical protein
MTMTRVLQFGCAILLLSGTLTAKQDAPALAAAPSKTPVPADVGPLAERLAADTVSVTVKGGATKLDFWWVKGLPIKAGTAAAPSWADVEEGALVGVVNLSSDYRDIRGRVIKPGAYTLRYGIQPANGDHLGVSPYREFLLLSPAAVDHDPAALGHDGTIELSKQSIGGSHPGVWSLDPPVAQGSALQVYKTELGHDGVIMEVPVVRDGTPAGTLKFGLVLIGKIEA